MKKLLVFGILFSLLFSSMAAPLMAKAEIATGAINDMIVGAPSQNTWTFKATKSGKYRIVFTYARGTSKEDTTKVAFFVKVLKKKGTNEPSVELSSTASLNLVKKGQEFTVTLEENASTGYSWSYKASGAAINLLSEENPNTAPIEDTIEGAPSQKTWKFEAEKSGTYQIVFSYYRPWESVPAAQTITYTVQVVNQNSTDDTVLAITTDGTNVIKIGQEFTVTLEENASTGYSWSYDTDDTAIVLK